MANCKGKINLKENKIYDECSNTCDFKYSYKTSPSSCTIRSKGNGTGSKSQYLDLKCFDGNNEINYSSLGNIEISQVRLYSPSLNKYSGKRQEAELVLQHIGNGKQIYVCIPIKIGGKNGRSVDWFKKLQLNTLPVKKGSVSNPTAANFKLDDVIPRGSYYVMNKNGLSFSNCSPANNIMILFSTSNPGYISQNELDLLKKRVSTVSSGHHTASTGEILYNKKGTKYNEGGTGDEEIMESECYQVTDGDGNPITDDDGKPWEGISSDWVKNAWGKSGNWFQQAYFWIALNPIPVCVILIIILGYFIYKQKIMQRSMRALQGLFIKKKAGSGASSGASSGTSTTGSIGSSGSAVKVDAMDLMKK